MKKYICIQIICMCSIFFVPTHLLAYKYGLGSCLDQSLEQVIWPAIKDEKLDGFIFLGDNVYGDQPNGKLLKMKNAYQIQKNKLPKWLMQDKEILAVWDDHDFGLNDGGKDYSYKEEAQKMFLNFWEIAENDPRNFREGLYFKKERNVDGTEIEIIALDTRYFRSKLNGKKNAYEPNKNPQATILGNTQWDWFESSIANSSARLIIILSSIQVLATDHSYEKWANFPLERSKLIRILSEAALDKTVIVVSGDRHRSGIYQNDYFTEITASSLNKPGSRFKESDPLLLGETFPEINYGVLNIQPAEKQIIVSIHNKKGKELNSKIIKMFKSKDRS